jgi:hypothetical protein
MITVYDHAYGNEYFLVTIDLVVCYSLLVSVHSVTLSHTPLRVNVFLPYNPRDHPHDDLVNYGEELDNHVRLFTHRANDSPKYETEEDNSKGISAGPETNIRSCVYTGLFDVPLSPCEVK